MPVYPVAAVRNKNFGVSSYISQWLLRDDFTTAEAAPIASPRPAQPGPGTLTILDTNGTIDVASGSLRFLNSVTGASHYTNPRIYQQYSRVVGRAAVLNYQVTARDLLFAWHSDSAPGLGGMYSSGVKVAGDSGVFAMILRSSGCFVVENNVLQHVYGNATTTPMYFVVTSQSATGSRSVNFLRILDILAPWNTDYGIATNRVASPATGATTTMEADALVEFTWTPAAGETLDLMVRRDSDVDCWSVVCANATAVNANTIKLIERNAGDTERSSAAQTFTAGVAYRILVVMSGTTINTFVSNVAKNAYASASHNQTATGVKVSGFTTGGNLVAWPRTLSGAAKAALDEVAA